MLGYDVNFAFRAAVVSFQEVIAVLFEEIPGQLFTQDTGISAFHLPIVAFFAGVNLEIVS